MASQYNNYGQGTQNYQNQPYSQAGYNQSPYGAQPSPNYPYQGQQAQPGAFNNPYSQQQPLGETAYNKALEEQPIPIYNFNLQYIDQFANQVVMAFDNKLEGKVGVDQFGALCDHFFKINLGVVPPPADVLKAVSELFKSRGVEYIGFREFKQMLYFLGGKSEI